MEESFEAITSQEQFDERIGPLLEAAREEVRKEYKDYEELKKQAEVQAGKIAALEGEAAKVRVAMEKELPYELAGRLQGKNEEDLRQDADRLLQYVGGKRRTPPQRDPEGPGTGGADAALKKMLDKLRKE